MGDQSVREALRSTSRLVVIEAPAGCGKTHQGAEYAQDVVTDGWQQRLLVLTHTHSACSVFSDRANARTRKQMDVRTIDSFIGSIASAYHVGLSLPSDIASWIRQTKDGHSQLATKVAALLCHRPMIAAALVARHPIVICDEHQDSNGDQSAVVMALLDQGARLRVFADPMQKIFKEKTVPNAKSPQDWGALLAKADAFEVLDTPHRWKHGCMQLGLWTLRARETLKSGGQIDLRSGLPASVSVHYKENEAQRNLDYRLTGTNRREIDSFEKAQTSLLVLSRYNETSRALRSHFNRRIALWEGHTRNALEKLANSMIAKPNDAASIAAAVVDFLDKVCKGFSPSAFGDRFQKEVADGCVRQSRGKPALIQNLARCLVEEPNHRGVEKTLSLLSTYIDSNADFADVKLDCHREFWDAVRLGRFDTVEGGLSEISHHRTFSRLKPHERSISTIHKAKGLECESVLLIPCDNKNFPDTEDSRCLLYVALTRAKSRLVLVMSRDDPSPLFTI